MQVTRRHNGPNCLTTRSAVSNRSRLLEGVDGRTASARRYRDLCRAFEAELGGPLNEVELGLVKQAATLTLRAEQMQGAVVRGEMVNSDQLIRLSGTARRILNSIAAKASKRKPAPNLTGHPHKRAAERAEVGG
jgi:hypothetical protein